MQRLKNIIKNSTWIYGLYYFLMSSFLSLLKVFVSANDKLILFVCFGGDRFDDSPKEIYDTMVKDYRFSGYEFVWAFRDTERYHVPVGRKIKIDTIDYFKTALKSRCWVTNSTVERGLNFKGKNTYYFSTWHGTPIKLMGSDIADSNVSFRSKSRNYTDTMCAQSDYEIEIFSKVFKIEKEKFLKSGLPRNDYLSHCNQEIITGIKEKLEIPSDKKIILYTPTFREYSQDTEKNYVTNFIPDFKKWKETLGENYIVLFRAHYAVSENIDFGELGDFVKNVSSYQPLNELMVVSDLLVSDYSSILFDFSITGKPMFSFCYDYEEYKEKRGMYFDIRKYIESAVTEEELLDKIKYDQNSEKTIFFREKYIEYYGTATRTCVDKIYDEIGV